MAKRLLTAAIAIPIGILILVLNNSHVLAGVTTFLSVVAVYEILSAAKYNKKYRSITVLSLVFSAFVPLAFCYDAIRQFVIVIAFVFLMLLFGATLTRHKEIRFEELGLIAFVSICVPLSIATIAYFMFRWPEHGIFFIVYTLVTAWIADGGAYFAGTFLGKHKLCPEISPKKTWEGFFGGLAASVVFAVLLGFGYELWDKIFTGENHFRVNILILCIVAFISTFLGLLGDLIASLMKRQCGVKDFGNFFPGHGGVMDRFDSVLFVSPFVYLAFQLFFPIAVI